MIFYKLIKEMPKREIGDFLILHEREEFYEWLKEPYYIMSKYIVEECDEFFEKIEINWEKGERIYFLNSTGEIIEHIFNPKIHLKYIISKNAFKEKDKIELFRDKISKILEEINS